jgi:hypothetical protein
MEAKVFGFDCNTTHRRCSSSHYSPVTAFFRDEVEVFINEDITMKQVIVNKGDNVKIGLTRITEHLQQSSGKVVLFCNSHPKSYHFSSELQKKLNLIQLDVDVFVINGALNKYERFWWIRVVNMSPKTSDLTSTNASNCGIYDSLIDFVVQFELPRDLNGSHDVHRSYLRIDNHMPYQHFLLKPITSERIRRERNLTLQSTRSDMREYDFRAQ